MTGIRITAFTFNYNYGRSLTGRWDQKVLAIVKLRWEHISNEQLNM